MNQILDFHLSAHSLLRLWERGLERRDLYKLLPHAKQPERGSAALVFPPAILKRKAIAGPAGQSLVLIVRGQRICTLFWCADPEYLRRAHPEQYYWVVRAKA